MGALVDGGEVEARVAPNAAMANAKMKKLTAIHVANRAISRSDCLSSSARVNSICVMFL
jgi:hypothetical protein